MRIYSWNVNGIRAAVRKEQFIPFINKHQPDILCMQETKAEKGQAEIDLPDYEEYWNSAEKKGYSGTAIFTKHKPLSVLNGFPPEIIEKYEVPGDIYGDPNKEGRIIAAEFERFYVVTVYTPNAKDDLSRIPMRQKHWDPAFLAYCKHLERKKPVIFCGDLNVAHTEDDL
ncbi:MAG TPA: exodeoxyribonuclease III, partial [Candidatus Saccharimonadales bacterium]|nr:exodeoxyribonuclease III [Candidatus Saccharimonadales bacterium]